MLVPQKPRRSPRMTANRRWDAKRDLAEPKIVEALEKAGCKVYRELVVDLLVRVPGDPPGVVRAMEVKTPTSTGKAPKDKRRKKQMEFIAETGTPYILTPEQALEAICKTI